MNEQQGLGNSAKLDLKLPFDWMKYVILLLTSIFLSSSLIFSVFSSFPITLAFLSSPRHLSLLFVLLGTAATYGLGLLMGGNVGLTAFYLIVSLFALIQTLFLKQRFHPKQVLLRTGFAFFALGLITATIIEFKHPQGLKGIILNQITHFSEEIKKNQNQLMTSGGESSVSIVDMFAEPKKLTEELSWKIFPTFFVLTMLWSWVNLFLVLRNRGPFFDLAFRLTYPWKEKDLTSFVTPAFMLIPFICLLLSLLSSDYLNSMLGLTAPLEMQNISITLLEVVGVFYFFQGIGVYLDFLSYVGIEGVFKTILLVFTMVTGPWILAVIGLFDFWADFRKFFKTKIDQK